MRRWFCQKQHRPFQNIDPKEKGTLKLSAEEEKQYMKERSKLPAPQQERIKGIDSSWLLQGRLEERQELVLGQLNYHLGTLDKQTEERLQKLTPEQLLALSRALLNFEKAADLNQWLDSSKQRTRAAQKEELYRKLCSAQPEHIRRCTITAQFFRTVSSCIGTFISFAKMAFSTSR
jgi:hypothetical protein